MELLRANAPERPVRLLGVRVGGFEAREGEASASRGADGTLSLLPAA
jgi:hypothetical protein